MVDVLNLAHGTLYLAGACLAHLLVGGTLLGLATAIAAGIVAGAAAGAAVTALSGRCRPGIICSKGWSRSESRS